MNPTYVVRSPIWGYSGMGFENTSVLEREFTDEIAARKRLGRCNKAWELHDLQQHWPAHGRLLTDNEGNFLREMCDGVSYHFTGPSTLVKRTVQDEVLL